MTPSYLFILSYCRHWTFLLFGGLDRLSILGKSVVVEGSVLNLRLPHEARNRGCCYALARIV